ncbi:MAG: CDP-alcohol phosphatidyltransferase family protein [Rhodospirillales bacterium]|nr:CDP-alcohol phosphatidyltransferase family protein [Rhodospirillales bacterium]
MIKNIPNLITVVRIFAVPYVVWLMLQNNFFVAFWVFIAAGISDALDGYLAKVLNARSKLGGYLDPLADKALIISVFMTLTYMERIDSWFIVLVLVRDLIIMVGALLYHLKTRSLEITPLFIGKTNTAFQVVLAGVLLAVPGLNLAAGNYLDIMLGLTAAITALSGGAYIIKWGMMAARFTKREEQ